MKKLFLLLLFLGLFNVTSAQEINFNIPVCVMVNKNYIKFNNKPVLINSVTYLPARFFCETFGADVEWIDNTQTVIISHKNNIIQFKIGESTATVNGSTEAIGGYARLLGDKTYLPLRFISEKLGGSVSWDNKYYTAEITMDNVNIPDEIIGGRNYSNDEIFWLARIISSESEDEPFAGKIAVGNVVLNRVSSPEYPDTIYSVIFDDKHGIQFQPVANGSIYKEAIQDAYLAAKLCLEGYNIIGECKYFLNPDKATSFWIPNNKSYYTSIGNHDFYF